MKVAHVYRFIESLKSTVGFLILSVAILEAHGGGLDQNKNGLNDAWEMLFQGHSLEANEDSDGDGFSNLAESLAGTDPLDPNSFPSLQLAPDAQGHTLFSWQRIPGKHYRILASTNLFGGTWSEETIANAD